MNITLEHWDRTISNLYDAILQPELLSEKVAQANTMMDSDFCHMLGVTPQGTVKFNIVTDPDFAHATHDYGRHFVDIDPRRKFADQQVVGTTYRCSSLFSTRFVDQNEFYQDFLRPNKLRYIIGACLYRSEGMSVYAAFNHNLGRKEFSDEEQKYFSLLNQHLGRVISTIDKSSSISTALGVGEHALDVLKIGVMGLSEDGTITYANDQANVELETLPLSKSGSGQLAEGSICRLLVQRVLDDQMPHGARLPDERIVTAFRSPGESDNTRIGISTYKTAVVMVFSRPNQRGPRTSHLIEWFGLSPAEARLANALAAGSSIEKFAATYSISVATARTQLRAVLKKTGAERQQELVRLLAHLPSL